MRKIYLKLVCAFFIFQLTCGTYGINDFKSRSGTIIEFPEFVIKPVVGMTFEALPLYKSIEWVDDSILFFLSIDSLVCLNMNTGKFFKAANIGIDTIIIDFTGSVDRKQIAISAICMSLGTMLHSITGGSLQYRDLKSILGLLDYETGTNLIIREEIGRLYHHISFVNGHWIVYIEETFVSTRYAYSCLIIQDLQNRIIIDSIPGCFYYNVHADTIYAWVNAEYPEVKIVHNNVRINRINKDIGRFLSTSWKGFSAKSGNMFTTRDKKYITIQNFNTGQTILHYTHEEFGDYSFSPDFSRFLTVNACYKERLFAPRRPLLRFIIKQTPSELTEFIKK